MATADKRKAVQAALDYTRQRRFDKAIAEYQNALKADSQDLGVYKKLGDLYAQTGAVQEAITTYMKLGDLYRADGLAVKAIAIYKMVLNLDPRNMQIYLACADLYAEQGLMGEAKIQYMTVAEHHTRAGETSKALEVYEKIANLDPTNFAVPAKVGEMCEKQKLPDKAAANYVAAAQAAARASQLKEAHEFYRRALRVKPQSYEAHFGLGKLHFETGAYREAATALERAAAGAPGSPAPLFLLGQCHRKLGSPVLAADVLRRGLEADPTATEPRLELARCLLEAGTEDEAYVEFGAAAGQMLEEGLEEDALALLQGLCEDHPRATGPLAKLAEIHQRKGRETEAREVQRRLASLHEERGEGAEAAAIYRKILEAVPSDPHCLARLQVLGEGGVAAGPEAEWSAPGGEPAAIREGLVREEEPQAVPIAESVGVPGEGVTALAEEEVGLGLVEGEVGEAAAGADVVDDAAEVAEQLAEADVYLKYGLVEKAVERLRETLAEVPQNLAARARLQKLFLDEGRTEEAVAEGLALADALVRRRQPDRAVQELMALLRVDPENREVQARLHRWRGGTPVGPLAPAPRSRGPVLKSTEAPATPAASPRAPVPPVAAEAAALPPATPPVPGTIPVAEGAKPRAGAAGWLSGESGPEAVLAAEGEEDALDLSKLLGLSDQESVEPSPVSEAEAPLVLGLEDVVGERAEAPLRLELGESAAGPEPAYTLSLGGIEEELSEAGFFKAQGLFDEAAALYRRVLAEEPGNAAALAGLEGLASESPAAEGPLGPAPPAEERMDAPARAEAPGGDTWIPGPGPFALEGSVDLEMSASAVPESPGLVGPGVDVDDLDLSRAEAPGQATAPPSLVTPAPPSRSAPVGSGTSPRDEAAGLQAAPPATPQAEPKSFGARPLPSVAPPAGGPGVSPAPPPSAAQAGPRRIGPAEEIPIFRVAAPTDARPAGGFVDLGAEIRKELSVPSEGAALLDALLEEFQRGVREHLDAEDYETHYNLGIAYKEMDLFDEAIEAFRLAGKDPARRLICSGLIALCLLRKGQAEQAIDELTRVLALPGHAPEEYQALRYDLATAHEAAGQDARALEVLETLLAQVPSFRDTARRVAVLQERLRQPAGRGGAPAPPARPAPGPPDGERAAESQKLGPAATPRADGASRSAPPPAGADREAPPEPASKPSRRRRDKISFV